MADGSLRHVAAQHLPHHPVASGCTARDGYPTSHGPIEKPSRHRLEESGLLDLQNLALTRVGGIVLDAWESAGALDDSDEHEVARCILLIRMVMRHGATNDQKRYRALYQNWLELRSIQPAEYWLESRLRMILPCYLNWSDSRSYNPFNALIAVTGGTFGTDDEWNEWEQTETAAGRSGLKDLLSMLGYHRPGGSRNFRRALELIYESKASPSTLPRTLEKWSL